MLEKVGVRCGLGPVTSLSFSSHDETAAHAVITRSAAVARRTAASVESIMRTRIGKRSASVDAIDQHVCGEESPHSRRSGMAGLRRADAGYARRNHSTLCFAR